MVAWLPSKRLDVARQLAGALAITGNSRKTGHRYAIRMGTSNAPSVEQRFPDDVALAAFAGFGCDETFGALPGCADPDNDVPRGVLFGLHDNEDLDHVCGSTRLLEFQRRAMWRRSSGALPQTI